MSMTVGIAWELPRIKTSFRLQCAPGTHDQGWLRVGPHSANIC